LASGSILTVVLARTALKVATNAVRDQMATRIQTVLSATKVLFLMLFIKYAELLVSLISTSISQRLDAQIAHTLAFPAKAAANARNVMSCTTCYPTALANQSVKPDTQSGALSSRLAFQFETFQSP
jgi:hypothetical protein